MSLATFGYSALRTHQTDRNIEHEHQRQHAKIINSTPTHHDVHNNNNNNNNQSDKSPPGSLSTPNSSPSPRPPLATSINQSSCSIKSNLSQLNSRQSPTIANDIIMNENETSAILPYRSSPNSSVNSSFGTASSSNSSLNNGYNSLNCSITSSTSCSYVNSNPTSTSSSSSSSTSSTSSASNFCNATTGLSISEGLKLLSIHSTSNNSNQPNHNINKSNQLTPNTKSNFNDEHQQPCSSPWINTNDTSALSPNASYSSLQAKPLKGFESRSAYVEAMKEDLAEWLNRLYPDLDLTSANFFARLETGSIICRHANYVTNMGRKSLTTKLNNSKTQPTIKNQNNNQSSNKCADSSSITINKIDADNKQRRKSTAASQPRSKIPRSKSNFFTPSKSYSSLDILINVNNNNNNNSTSTTNNTCLQTDHHSNNNQSSFDKDSIRGGANCSLPATQTAVVDSISGFSEATHQTTTCQQNIAGAISPQQRHYQQQERVSQANIIAPTTPSNKNKFNMIDWLKVRVLPFKPDARSGTFFARDNICQFILWCRSLNILDCLLFETDDLVARKNERSFILCMLEVARIGFDVGVPTPLIIQLEQEIDREIENDAKQQDDLCKQDRETTTTNHTINDQPNYVKLLEQDEAEANDKEDDYGPKPQVITNDLMSLHEKVVQLLCQCTCPTQFPMVRVGDNGKYKVGDKLIIFVRILRRHIMVRVGGGWQELSEFLRAKDPCRMRLPNQSQCGSNYNCQQSPSDWSSNVTTPSSIGANIQQHQKMAVQRISNGNLQCAGSSSGLMTIASNLQPDKMNGNNNNSDYNCYPSRSTISGSASMNWLSHNSRN